MADIEKVIKGLEYCIKSEDCRGCIYWEEIGLHEGCPLNLDALAMLKEQDELFHKKQHDVDRLCNEISEWKHKFHDKLLKEQEAVEPIAKEDDTYECICGAIVGWDELDASGIVQTRFNYCPFCGRPVKWNG